MTCSMTRRNPDHICSSPLKTFAVKRVIDNCYGHLTICEGEAKRLEETGWFKFTKQGD